MVDNDVGPSRPSAYDRLMRTLQLHVTRWKQLSQTYDTVVKQGPSTRTQVYQAFVRFSPQQMVTAGPASRATAFQRDINNTAQGCYSLCKQKFLTLINDKIELATNDINDIYRQACSLLNDVDHENFFTEGELFSRAAQEEANNFNPFADPNAPLVKLQQNSISSRGRARLPPVRGRGKGSSSTSQRQRKGQGRRHQLVQIFLQF